MTDKAMVTDAMVDAAAEAIWETWREHKGSDATWDDARKAYEQPHKFPKLYDHVALCLDEARAALFAALAQAGQPVAWYRDKGFVTNFHLSPDKPANATSDPHEWKPLYASPSKIEPVAVDGPYSTAEDLEDALSLDRGTLAHPPAKLEAGETSPAPVPHTMGIELPTDIIESLLAIGSVEWGQTFCQADERHVDDFRDTLRITREHFGIEAEETTISYVALEGTGTVLANTGMSPNSAQHARILTAAWNQLVEIAKANAATEGSENG